MSFDPGADVDALDYIMLAGVQSPGLIDIDGASSPRKWDEQQGYGASGATLKYTGDGLAEFTVTFKLWLTGPVGHFAQWAALGFEALLKKTTPGQKPKAMDIVHPFLSDLEITSVVVTEPGQWIQTDDGLWTKPVKFKQYRAPKPSIGKPDGSVDGPKDPLKVTDQQDLDNIQNGIKAQALAAQNAATP